MKASDVMTVGAATIRSDASVPEAARLMLQYAISGLPVVDATGHLVGIITEGDFLRRTETGTGRPHRPRWLEFLFGPGRLADEYVHSHSRKVEEVMTRQVVTVAEETPVDEIARLMERHRIVPACPRTLLGAGFDEIAAAVSVARPAAMRSTPSLRPLKVNYVRSRAGQHDLNQSVRCAFGQRADALGADLEKGLR